MEAKPHVHAVWQSNNNNDNDSTKLGMSSLSPDSARQAKNMARTAESKMTNKNHCLPTAEPGH